MYRLSNVRTRQISYLTEKVVSMKPVLVTAALVLTVAGLGACSSNAGPSTTSSAPATSAAAVSSVKEVCAQVVRELKDQVPSARTKQSVQAVVVKLRTINASASPEAQAQLTPLIAAFVGIENIDFTANIPPAKYEPFIKASNTYGAACTAAGVPFPAISEDD